LLRAEIDEAAWSSLYSTVSAPFDPPASGKIAVKVINHRQMGTPQSVPIILSAATLHITTVPRVPS